jgi:hypothetical protein
LLRDSDDNCVEFAAFTLSNLRFLYKKANGDDKSVCTPSVSINFRVVVVVVVLMLNAEIPGPLSRHICCANLRCTLHRDHGAQKIPGVDKPGVLANPAGGLALSCAVVSTRHPIYSRNSRTDNFN